MTRFIAKLFFGFLLLNLGLEQGQAQGLEQGQAQGLEQGQCDPKQFFKAANPKHLSPLVAGHLDSWEMEALSRYTQQDYDWINGDLRFNTTPIAGDLKRWVDGIDGALSKISIYQGRSFRGTHLPEKVLAQYQPGGPAVSDKAYLSTSASPAVVMSKWNPENQGVFIAIDGISGRDIRSYAYLPDEQEVLFARNTLFQVVSRCQAHGQDSKKDYWVIHLREQPIP